MQKMGHMINSMHKISNDYRTNAKVCVAGLQLEFSQIIVTATEFIDDNNENEWNFGVEDGSRHK